MCEHDLFRGYCFSVPGLPEDYEFICPRYRNAYREMAKADDSFFMNSLNPEEFESRLENLAPSKLEYAADEVFQLCQDLKAEFVPYVNPNLSEEQKRRSFALT